MKKLFAVSVLVVVLTGMALYFDCKTPVKTEFANNEFTKELTNEIATVKVSEVINNNITYPYSLAYIGDNKLIVTDLYAIKQWDITTDKIDTLIEFTASGFAIDIVFKKETNTIYILNYENEVWTYNISTKSIGQITDTDKLYTAVIDGEDEVTTDFFKEEITDILGNELPEDVIINMSIYRGNDSNNNDRITVDKFNRTVWYIDNTNTKQRVIKGLEIDEWWSFKQYQNDHHDWQAQTPLLSSENLYYRTSVPTIMYEYPSKYPFNEMKELYTIPANKTVLSLHDVPTFGLADDRIETFPDWRYVLYEHEFVYNIGYIYDPKGDGTVSTLLPVEEADYKIADLSNNAVNLLLGKDKAFEVANGYFGRIIRYEAPVYKYPTCVIPTLTVDKATKTQADGTNARKLNNLIKIKDTLNSYYFEVDILNSKTGQKIGVGFIPQKCIIDINAPSEHSPVVSNAEIMADTGEMVTVYEDAECTKPLTEIYLKDGDRIHIITNADVKANPNNNSIKNEKYKRNSYSNKIYYNDPEIGEWWLIEGYIETKYIKPDGMNLSAGQWIGLVLLSSVLIGVSVAFIIVAMSRSSYEKKKRRALNEQSAAQTN